jgi:Flp pilus assembly protein TadG
MKRLLTLHRDSNGAVAVEFALVGPIMIILMLGVLQIGMTMWAYNSLRGVASDIERFAVVNSQAASVNSQAAAQLSNSQIQQTGQSIAITAPYSMTGAVVTVADATTQQISGAKELTLTITYNAPSILSVVGMGNIPMSYSRPIFLLTT